MTAFHLAGHFRVLVIEAHALPRYKSCSEVLIKKSVEFLKNHFGCILDRTFSIIQFIYKCLKSLHLYIN
ncbi:hypothetical protein KCX82_15925 [Clostridiales bacterium BAD-6]|uniref:Uncharacterized protein n=2 Tax=Sinanaerobacter chloroacetimidivorans TaxID=2818044 RepID=A0A8J7W5M3_9FIRM|nr:hypothetical protein [Sinanaerobacter chloroacetimidivorans]